MPRSPLVQLGPWLGIDERGNNPQALAAAFNLDFVGGRIQHRKNRLELSDLSAGIYPTRVVRSDYNASASKRVDWEELTWRLMYALDSTLLTTFYTSNNANPSELWVGCPFPFASVMFEVITAGNSAVNSTALAHYWNGSTYTARTVSSDTTSGASGGGGTITLLATGKWTFAAATDWRPDAPVVNGRQLPRMFWMRLRITSTTDLYTTGELGRIRVGLPTDTGATAINGLMYSAFPNGERHVLLGCDDKVNGHARLLRMFFAVAPGETLASINWQALALPATIQTGPDAYWRGVVFGGKLILMNGESTLCVFDGFGVEQLTGIEGADSGARAYVAPPVGTEIATYNGAVYVAGIKGAPRTIQRSVGSNEIAVFQMTEAEQAGAANYWPAGEDADATASDSTFPESGGITGLATLGGKLLILTRQRPFLFDDSNSMQPLSGNTGCIAPRSVASVGDSVIYLGDRAIFRLAPGEQPQRISGPIEPETLNKHLNLTAAKNAVAVVSVENSQYRLYVPMGGDPRNRTCLVYSYKDGTWAVWGDVPPWADRTAVPYSSVTPATVTATCVVSDPGDPEELITGDDEGFVWLEDAIDDDARASITDPAVTLAYGITSRLLQEDSSEKLFREWYIHARKEGYFQLNALVAYDGEDPIGALDASLRGNNAYYGTVQLNGEGIAPNVETEPWFGQTNTVYASGHDPLIGTARWTTREWRRFKLSLPNAPGRGDATETAYQSGIQRRSKCANFGQLIFWMTDHRSLDILGWELDFEYFKGSKR